MDKILQVRDLCKTYIVNSVSNNVLRNISFELEKGEFVSVMGPSGSGKSTLLYTVSGMEKMTSGSVLFSGADIRKMSEKELETLRLNNMGFIFQKMYMLRKLCIYDNIVLPGYQSDKFSRKEINRYAEELMRRLGITETALHEVNEVSGGQLQRACLCRALINRPEIIFADEPTGSLNSSAAEDVMREILNVSHEGTAVMMVTHSVRVAAMSERVIYISDGRICGEIKFGKTSSEKELASRERRLTTWLMEKGW